MVRNRVEYPAAIVSGCGGVVGFTPAVNGGILSSQKDSLTKQPEARRRVRDGLALVAPATSVPTRVTGQPGLFHALSSETQRGRPSP
ncbi:MAG: hypothetical protein A07HR60_00595 [uncultured archaeon A07HR60]|nr:MAG: hypothetical protein A07HR60_00595 [uncultured archaeon A07HR60]